MPDTRIMPAEWSQDVASVLMAYPHENTDWAYMIDEARSCFNEIIKCIVEQAGLTVVIALLTHRRRGNLYLIYQKTRYFLWMCQPMTHGHVISAP